jgi:hypothetical protein
MAANAFTAVAHAAIVEKEHVPSSGRAVHTGSGRPIVRGRGHCTWKSGGVNGRTRLRLRAINDRAQLLDVRQTPVTLAPQSQVFAVSQGIFPDLLGAIR